MNDIADNTEIVEDKPSTLLDDISWPEVDWEKLVIIDVVFYGPENIEA